MKTLLSGLCACAVFAFSPLAAAQFPAVDDVDSDQLREWMVRLSSCI